MKQLLPLLLFFISSLSCTKSESILIENSGNAQGSTYQIKYVSENGQNYEQEIKQILKDIDASMSTWVPTSLISKVNDSENWVEVDDMFMDVLTRSIEIAEESNGDFDPTVGPLVRLWGFWFDERRESVTELEVNNAMALVGYERIQMDGKKVKLEKESTIDFNAIAQGYTVDHIAEFLEKNGIKHYMVEVGGEVRTRGKNMKDKYWVIGVDKPQETIDAQNRFQFILSMENRSLATSGNYRKFWVDEETGLKYAHTIDPQTGYPAKNNLLSASILARTAMDADAYATLCMVQGLEECVEFLASKEELEGYLVYVDEGGNWQEIITEGFKSQILE